MRQKLKLHVRKELILNIRMSYQQSSWKEKNKILDGFIATTGYQRKYAIQLLSKNKITMPSVGKRKVNLKYDQEVQTALITAWHAANRICSKRLVPFLPKLVSTLERYGQLEILWDTRTRLLSISPATADRLLKSERQKRGQRLSTTKSGNLLKKETIQNRVV